MGPRRFLPDLLERALKTAAQTAAAMLAAGQTILQVDLGQVAAVSATAAVVSALTSIASYRVGETGTASLLGDHR